MARGTCLQYIFGGTKLVPIKRYMFSLLNEDCVHDDANEVHMRVSVGRTGSTDVSAMYCRLLRAGRRYVYRLRRGKIQRRAGKYNMQ